MDRRIAQRNSKSQVRWIAVLILVMSVAPALPVLAGRGFLFRRSARSYRAPRIVSGSYGSHGATGGGRVVYSNAYARTVQTANRPAGSYTSHGAVGGTPQGQAIASPSRITPTYGSNQVIVRRTPASQSPSSHVTPRVSFPTSPVPCEGCADSEVVELTKRTTFPEPPSNVAPPSPSSPNLARVAYQVDSRDLAAIHAPWQSITRLESRRKIALTPWIDSPLDTLLANSEPEELLLESDLKSSNSTASEPTTSPDLDPVKLVSFNEPIDRAVSKRTISTSNNVLAYDGESAIQEEPSLTHTSDDHYPGDELTATETSVGSKANVLTDVTANSLDLKPLDRDLDASSSLPDEESTRESATPNDLSSILVRQASHSEEVDTTTDEPIRDDQLVNTPSQPESDDTEVAEVPKASQPGRVRLVLNVPADADVFLMGRKMVTMGDVRQFNVPINDPDKLHQYRIRVATRRGSAIETTQLLRAGQRVELTFESGSGGLAVAPATVSTLN